MFGSSFAPRSGMAAVAGGAVLTAAVLAGSASAPALGAPVVSDYTCTIPGTPGTTGTGPQTLKAQVDVALPAAKAGQPLAAGAVSFGATITVPATVYATTAFAGATSLRSDDFAIPFGSSSIAAPVGPLAKGNPDAQMAVPFTGKGANKAVILPASGTYAVTMPKAFNLVVVNGTGTSSTIPCAITTPASLGSTVLSAQTTRTEARARKSIAAAKRLKVKVSVTNEFGAAGGARATGRVVAKEGKKVLGKGSLVNGAATLRLKKLTPGKHRVVVSYAGDAIDAASAAKTINVLVAARG